jgi:hypothetical protein
LRGVLRWAVPEENEVPKPRRPMPRWMLVPAARQTAQGDYAPRAKVPEPAGKICVRGNATLRIPRKSPGP